MPTAAPHSPVALIEGIGPAIAARLAQIGVSTVFDLLRAGVDDLHAGVHEVASRDQVERWRSMAALLQVRDMTNQWAEALVVAGHTSIERLHGAGHGAWSAALNGAVAAGITPDVPDASRLADLRRDAAVLRHCGALNVRVRDEQGEPVAEAQVRVGSVGAECDARGRARLTRLPLGRHLRVVVQRAGFETLERALAPDEIRLDEHQVGITELVLAAAAAGAQPARLSELDGDRLPALAADAMTTEARSADQLRDGDVLMLRRYYSDGTTAQLTSKFLEYEAGRFLAISYRVELTSLPPGIEPRRYVIRRAGSFHPFRLTPGRLRQLKARRRAARALAGLAPPQTLVEKDARMRALAELLAAELVTEGGGA